MNEALTWPAPAARPATSIGAVRTSSDPNNCASNLHVQINPRGLAHKPRTETWQLDM
jgi:hypothetical protein